jgi:hypothetical protein
MSFKLFKNQQHVLWGIPNAQYLVYSSETNVRIFEFFRVRSEGNADE